MSHTICIIWVEPCPTFSCTFFLTDQSDCVINFLSLLCKGNELAGAFIYLLWSSSALLSNLTGEGYVNIQITMATQA